MFTVHPIKLELDVQRYLVTAFRSIFIDIYFFIAQWFPGSNQMTFIDIVQ